MKTKLQLIKEFINTEIKKQLNEMKLYVRTPHRGNEFKVCDEMTDECIAIFFDQKNAVEYSNWKNKK